MKLLTEILSMRRPHRGVSELFLAEGILSRLPGDLRVYNNAEGLPMAFVYVTDETSRTLFTAHLDTVHKADGFNPVIFDTEMEWMSKADGEPLGADDGAGVWLLYRMAEAGVPGTYLFPVGEEKGGVGSRWVAANAEIFLSKFDRAIAFDRKGTSSVITHQSYGRCCSDEFAAALCAALTTTIPNSYSFVPDSGGVYTDTAEFVDIISECTNISVGYAREHTGGETLDTAYLTSLLAACITVNWEALPAARDPSVVEVLPSRSWSWGDDGKWTGDALPGDDDVWGSKHLARSIGPMADGSGLVDIMTMTDEEIYDWVYTYPEEAAELLIASR